MYWFNRLSKTTDKEMRIIPKCQSEAYTPNKLPSKTPSDSTDGKKIDILKVKSKMFTIYFLTGTSNHL